MLFKHDLTIIIVRIQDINKVKVKNGKKYIEHRNNKLI